MSSPANDSADGRRRYVTPVDEMSLADEQSGLTPESDADTLEVRDDSVVILQSAMGELRRPMLIAAGAVVTAALLVVSLGSLVRMMKGNSA
jgi:hypothetical protein